MSTKQKTSPLEANAETLRESQEKLKQAYSLAGEAATDMVDQVKIQAKDQLGVTKEKASEMSVRAENVIKEQPLVSIGCAFAAGWLFSKLVK